MKRPKFQPPPPAPPPPPEPQLQLYDKPEDQILLHGEMIRDAATIGEILQGLPFAGHDYRGNLRVIISANLRIRDVCLALLGEKASNIIDEAERSSTIVDSDPDVDEDALTGNSYPTRKNGRSPKKPPAADPAAEREPGGRKLQILQLLRKNALTSGQIVEEFKGTASTQSIYQTLTDLRNSGLIDTRNDPLDGERKNFIK
jgi:hypothetical protein